MYSPDIIAQRAKLIWSFRKCSRTIPEAALLVKLTPTAVNTKYILY